MNSITLYHNPRCSKSRAALRYLEEADVSVNVVRYLDDPFTLPELKKLVQALGASARALLRAKDAAEVNPGLADPSLSETQLLRAIVEHPKLLERPIAVCGDRAVIGRPPEAVLELVSAKSD